MANTASWAWSGTGTWPSFRANRANNIDNRGNGLAIDPAGYQDITWVDGNNNNAINDNDGSDGTSAGTDRVIVNGVSKTVHEVGAFVNSTVTVKGITYTVTMGVWVFTDGTYMVRMDDASIPPDAHHKKVTAIDLGTWNGTEYTASLVDTRDQPFVCFTAGTHVDTPTGPRPVESLQPGDRVSTRDHGVQPLRWVGRRTISGRGRFAPILIRRGALGNARDIRLSPHHRVLIGGWRAELYAGTDEVLVAAHLLIDGQTIRRDPCNSVTYVHLLFDRHQIVTSDGLESESFHPAAYGLGVLDAPTRAEVAALFGDIPDLVRDYGPTARPCLHRWEAEVLLAA